MVRLVLAFGALCLGGCSSCGGGGAPSAPVEADPAATTANAASAAPSFHKLPHAHRRLTLDGGVSTPLLVPPTASSH